MEAVSKKVMNSKSQMEIADVYKFDRIKIDNSMMSVFVYNTLNLAHIQGVQKSVKRKVLICLIHIHF